MTLRQRFVEDIFSEIATERDKKVLDIIIEMHDIAMDNRVPFSPSKLIKEIYEEKTLNRERGSRAFIIFRKLYQNWEKIKDNKEHIKQMMEFEMNVLLTQSMLKLMDSEDKISFLIENARVNPRVTEEVLRRLGASESEIIATMNKANNLEMLGLKVIYEDGREDRIGVGISVNENDNRNEVILNMLSKVKEMHGAKSVEVVKAFEDSTNTEEINGFIKGENTYVK